MNRNAFLVSARTALRLALGIAIVMLSSCTLVDGFVASVSGTPTESPDARAAGTRSAGEGTAAAPADANREFTVIAHGDDAAVRIPLARAITQDRLYADLWAALTANESPAPARPAVDFSKETLVVVLLGDRPTAGYSVRIESVEAGRTVATVRLSVTTPSPGAIVAQVATSPYLLATLPFAGKNVTFTGDDLETGYVGE